ncbi:MAG: hypothetical protein ACXV5F_05390 [Halobacteriota archaeon]
MVSDSYTHGEDSDKPNTANVPRETIFLGKLRALFATMPLLHHSEP